MPKHIQLKDKDGNTYPNIIVEKIVNTNGTALKYADGTMICYGKKTYSNVVSTTDYWGVTNRTPEDMYCDYPATFISLPTTIVNYRSNQGGCLGLFQAGTPTTTKTGNYGVAVAKSSTSNRDIYLDYIAIGRWK